MKTWNKRATQGALIRLAQTGMVKRFRVRKTKSEDSWITCIEVLREPRAEDVSNLGFRRQVTTEDDEDAGGELLDDDADGDALMRDLVVDHLGDDDDAPISASHNICNSDRIPPQWTPDRFLANVVFDVVALGGASGWDSGQLRNRIVGPFWRRPLESYFTRLTDDWEKTQPPSLRHLAIVRDSRNTQEKKFLHYVYRTYKHFEEAVDAGGANWAGVSQSAPIGTGKQPYTQSLDVWGFQILELKDFLLGDGSATISDVRSAIVHPRKYGPRWDNALTQEIGYDKSEPVIPKSKQPRKSNKPVNPLAEKLKLSKAKKGGPSLSLTPGQRISLGLKPNGRLSKAAEKQILAHRKETGDPTSLPEKIVDEPSRGGSQPLMTAQERIAADLPASGRLGLKAENKIREERGLPKIAKKPKAETRKMSEPTVLSKVERINLGWTEHGRLPQEIINGLREERKNGIELKDSEVIKAWMDVMRAAKIAKDAKSRKNSIVEAGLDEFTTVATPESTELTIAEDTAAQSQSPCLATQSQEQSTILPSDTMGDTPTSVIRKKRKADVGCNSPRTLKMPRTGPKTTKTKSSSIESPSVVELLQNAASSASAFNALPSEATLTSVEPPSKKATQEQVPKFTHDETGSDTALGRSTESSNLESHSSSRSEAESSIESSQPAAWLDLLPPTKLSAKAQTTYQQYLARSSPGVFIDSFSRHKIGRGRPRKAFIATFRLARLKNFEWFNVSQSTPTQTSHHSSTEGLDRLKDGKDCREKVHDDATFDQPSSSHTDRPCESNTPLRQMRGIQEKIMYKDEQILTSNSPVTNELFESSNLHVYNATEHAGSILRDTNASLDLTALAPPVVGTSDIVLYEQNEAFGHVSESVHTHKQKPDEHPSSPTADEGLENTEEQGPPETLSGPRIVAGWAAINTAKPPIGSAYESPYAPSIQPEHTPQSHVDGTCLYTGHIDTTATGTIGTQHENILASQPFTTIVEVKVPPHPTGYKRRKKQKTLGSGLVIRRKIILDIIGMCDGAFPDQGEIGRPFSKLWDQYQENATIKIEKPIASTVNETLRNMCLNPDSGLKQMRFFARNKVGPGLAKRAIVTHSELTPNSPQVQQLALNIALLSHDKSHQYFPEKIRHLIDDVSLYEPLPLAPKDETIVLKPKKARLESQILRARKKVANRKAYQKRREATFAKVQNALVEQGMTKYRAEANGDTRAKRTRLASLNDKTKRFRRAPMLKNMLDDFSEGDEDLEVEGSDAEIDTAPYTMLTWTQPILAHHVNCEPAGEDELDSDDDELDEESPEPPSTGTQKAATDTAPSTPVHKGTGVRVEQVVEELVPSTLPKGKKRVKIAIPQQPSSKRARLSTTRKFATQSTEVQSGSEDSNASSNSKAGDVPDEETRTQTKQAARKARIQRGKPGPLPTLLERLTGLTGNPNDPVYQQPERKRRGGQPRSWSERKTTHRTKERKDRTYTEHVDRIDEFKKLGCTLVIAASMSGQDGVVDWTIVSKIYSSDHFFDMPKTKRLWAWMQSHMAVQVTKLTKSFQTLFLEAYERGDIAAIDDFDTYDWAGLIRWALINCVYPEIPLPILREALCQFAVDESTYETLNRTKWYREKIADRTRTLLQLQQTFVAPLHRSRHASWSAEDKVLKARSWVRANTATPQLQYDGKHAHDKLMDLGEHTLVSVVGDFVDKQNLRMRRLKRLLPGRNYNFTKAFARKYVRPFELNDFMVAVKVKKEMDIAFADDDPQKRFYSISRSEEDGSTTAVLALVSEGQVKLIPQLPPVNNEFGAPLPRLSIWGFCEGDYIHRAIDRERLFWDVFVVPTAKYQYGNPLQPLDEPLVPAETGAHVLWPSLPEPPLPGKQDSDALLPIWSSIDGQSITWPWWYRILNLVLQPLILQPGATSSDIYSHCAEHTTELFEINLVLDWLEFVNAVSKTIDGGYITRPGFWAAFGDELHGTDGDWFGEHVKRKAKNQEKQQWREEYNLRHSTLQARVEQQDDIEVERQDEDATVQDGDEASPDTAQQILHHPRRQYRITQQALGTQQAQEGGDGEDPAASHVPRAILEQEWTSLLTDALGPSLTDTTKPVDTLDQGLEMVDVDAEGEDVDAEGEVDDTIY